MLSGRLSLDGGRPPFLFEPLKCPLVCIDSPDSNNKSNDRAERDEVNVIGKTLYLHKIWKSKISGDCRDDVDHLDD